MKTKTILLSIKPKFVAKILNGEKTIEIRKKFPADFKGYVYIYCTKNIGKHGENQLLNFFKGNEYFIGEDIDKYNPNDICYLGQNGKVVARFWCDKVYDIFAGASALHSPRLTTWTCKEMCVSLCRDSCVSQEYLDTYLGKVKGYPQGYAIHISKLDVFDKPREIKEFYGLGTCNKCVAKTYCTAKNTKYHCGNSIETPPTNFQYIKEE